MNKFIVDLVNFFQKSTNLRLDLRLDLRLELLREMVDSSGPDSNNRNLNLNPNLNISLNIKIDEFSFIYRFFIVLLETVKETNFFISKRL